jgi:hypothetical protein
MRGGFDCRGYAIKLAWIDPDTQAWEQKIRRVVVGPGCSTAATVYDETSTFLNVDVQRALERVDQKSSLSKAVLVGPFSVFPLRGNRGTSGESPPDKTESLSSSSLPANDEDDVENDIEHTRGSSEGTKSKPVSPSSSLSSGAWSTAADSLSPTSAHVELDKALYIFSTAKRPPPATTVNPALLRHLDLLPRPAEQRELIHHWVEFVSWHLVPVDGPDNPFRSVFTPMALAGLNSPSSQTDGQIALFHALCATAAFSRGQLLDNKRARTLAMKHYNLAVIHLRHCLEKMKDQHLQQRDSILATITAFSAMDMITGRSSEWRTHLQGGASWLATIERSAWSRDKSSSMVYQGYLAVAALCNISLPPDIECEDDCADEDYYVLDRFFGLTRPILKHIVRMNSLLRQASHGNSDPELFRELEIRLHSQVPNADNLDLDGLKDTRARELSRHHAYVFYYASLIYFQRTIRRRRPDHVQGMVTSALSHLEEIERLGADVIGCTLVWPPFIVACECQTPNLQARMLAWYTLKRRHGFMNLEISKDVAMELWRRRALTSPTGPDVHWQDILTDLDIDIVLA